MYRTDRVFMKNPATAPSRIYIGNLAESVVPDNLEERFAPHGKILGLVLQRGFGFIQYEHESQAQSAIDNEHGTPFHGRKLNVKQAIDNTKGKPMMQQNSMHNQKNPYHNQHQNPYRNQFQNQQQPNNAQNTPRNGSPIKEDPVKPPNEQLLQKSPAINQKPPAMNQTPPTINQKPPAITQKPPVLNEKPPPGPAQNTPGPVSKPPAPAPKPAAPVQKTPAPVQKPTPPAPTPAKNATSPQPSPTPAPLMQQKLSNPMPQQDIISQKSKDDGPPDKKNKRLNKGGNGRPIDRTDRPPKRDYRDDYRDKMPPYYEPAPQYNSTYHAPIERPERNDCEIIVVAKALTEYAEYIEQRLKTLGLIVDLLFPNEDVPIGRVLANISSRGCLFAILVMPQNEEHRSLTLNVLHGIPEEHRNMPIEDSFLLITRNFEAYMRGEKFGVGGPESDKMLLTTRHPEYIQVIMNLLAENRQINSSQYDKLIGYLQEKRELQSVFEVAEGMDSGIEPETKNKQAELQSRIMNILNKKGDDVPPHRGVEPAKTPTPLLNDPSVQKALDSLLLGDMFKGLTS